MADKQSTDFRWHRRALDCIAQGALTNSKRPECHVKGVYPTHLQKGQGCYVWDMQGRKYMDFITGLGTNLLGYGHPRVNGAIAGQLQHGACLSLGTHHEIEAAEMIKGMFSFVDAVKFLKTGSEACSAAIKIARAYQGVAYGSKNLHEMWFVEIARRLPPQIEDYWQAERDLQGLHQGTPLSTESKGNKTSCSKEIREDSRRAGDRGSSFEETPGQGYESWKEFRLSCSEKSAQGWKTRQEFVRDMWKYERSSSSSRLQSTAKRDVALSQASRDGARWLVLSDGYHGHHDEFTSLTSPGVGIPTQNGILPLTGNEDLIEIAAAVIVEPVITDWSDERRKYLQNLRDRCTRDGTLLIFDEVITGFRFPRHGVTNYWGIVPDIICLGKAVANGMPLAVVGGKYDVMNCDEYFVSSSYAGETLSLVAAKETMSLLQKKYDLEGLWAKGQKWLNEFNSIAPDIVKIEGYPTRGVFKGDPMAKALFFQEACLAGILFGPSWFFNFPLSEDAFDIMGSLKEILGKIRRGEVKLRGDMPCSPFSQKVREAK